MFRCWRNKVLNSVGREPVLDRGGVIVGLMP